ncbi:MAG: hypothetical protein WC975_15115, partial [Phycisphaerae bacterium]
MKNLLIVIAMVVVFGAAPLAHAVTMQDSVNWERGFEFTTDPTSGWSVWYGNPGAVTTVSNGVLNFKPTSQWTLWNTNSGSNPLGTGDWSMEWRVAIVTISGSSVMLYADTNSSKENVSFRTGFGGDGQIYGEYQISPTSPVTAGLMHVDGLDYSAYHVYRLTRTTGVTGTFFRMYLDDNPVPLVVRDLVMTTKNADDMLGFGNGSATGEYNLDYIRWTTTGAYPPVSAPVLSLGRGHQVLLDRGLQISALVFVSETGYFDPSRWAESNLTAINFWGSNYPITLMPPPPGIPWARLSYAPTPQLTYPQGDELLYVPSLYRIQLKDEQDITVPTELADLAEATATYHRLFPHVIVHTNQGRLATGLFTVEEVRNYMQIVQPDMLMFDEYPFGAVEYSGISPTAFYEYMERYRKLGLEGNDGTRAYPIPTGVFLRTFYTQSLSNASIVSESEIRVQYFAAWAFGYKLLECFVYDKPQHNPSVDSVMFSGNGTANPTTTFYQVAETNRQSLNLGPALVRLLSSDVRFIVGRHNGQYNTLPAGIPSWDSTAGPYITDISATNIGTKNNGQEGDVIVGYLKPLAAEFTNSGHENDVYFMIVNALSDTGLAA